MEQFPAPKLRSDRRSAYRPLCSNQLLYLAVVHLTPLSLSAALVMNLPGAELEASLPVS
jgi:hypothetical protein